MNVAQNRKMVGIIKEFDREEHSTYDKLGRDAVKNFLNKDKTFSKWKTIDNPNVYGIDLLTLDENGKVIFCWEIEVRHGNWQGDKPFPFSEINCIERKDHQWRKEKSFLSKIPYQLSDKCKIYYIQLNKECTRAVFINSESILKKPLKPWKNRKAMGEYVRQVPISETLQTKISTR